MKLEEEIKGRFRNDYHKAVINLIYTSKVLQNEFLSSLKKHNITEHQYNVLRILRGFRDQSPLSIGFIKERMLDKDSDVSRLVDKLFERKLLNRVENPSDRRQKSIEITEDGLLLLSNMLECEKKNDSLLSKLNQAEIEQLNNLLDKARTVLD